MYIRISMAALAGLLATTSLAAASGTAPWTRLSNPNGGNAQCFLFDHAHPGVALAGTDAGNILRSTDGGANWTPVQVGTATEEFRVVAQSPADPNVFFAFSTGYTND